MINSQFSLLICFVAVIGLTNANKAPFIEKCIATDSKCLKQSTKMALPFFADGIPDLGIKPIDPFYLTKIDASSQNLKLELNDVSVKGLKDCIIKKVQRDVEKSKLLAKVMCNIDLDGQYEMKGSLLILPIEGKGKVRVILRKVVLNADLDLDEIVKDGKKYWNVKDWKHNYELKEKATVEFENLFNGNEVLGRAARELIATSSNEIVYEVGAPVVKTVVAHAVDTIQTFFRQVPMEDLVLN